MMASVHKARSQQREMLDTCMHACLSWHVPSRPVCALDKAASGERGVTESYSDVSRPQLEMGTALSVIALLSRLIDLILDCRSQARLPEIDELEKQIKATNEELADAQFKAREDASTAAAMHKALQDDLEQARAEVGRCSHTGSCHLWDL